MTPRFTGRRELGRTGFNVTSLGIGDLADRQVPIEQCVATVRRAMDAGLNLIDTAPGYEDGYSERIVGRALRESGRRDRMFVINKIDHHDEPVASQVDASLANMGLDYVDLFVFHGLSTLEGWRRLTAPASAMGGMEQLRRCVDAGKVRFTGISSHHPDVLRQAIPSGLCDVVMFPLGPFVDRRYVEEILPLAKEHGVGSVCFKTFGAGKLLADTTGYSRPLQNRPRGKTSSGGAATTTQATMPRLTVRECVHYTMTLDPDVALLGLSFPNEQDAAFAAAADFAGLSPREMADIRFRALEARRGKGPCWWNPNPEV